MMYFFLLQLNIWSTYQAFCVRYMDLFIPHLVCVCVVEEVGPVWISLHKPELKQLSETQLEDVETDLERRKEICVYCNAVTINVILIFMLQLLSTSGVMFCSGLMNISYFIHCIQCGYLSQCTVTHSPRCCLTVCHAPSASISTVKCMFLK